MSRKIFITESDKHKLLEIINKYEDSKNKQNLKDLEAEINRADVTSHEQMPSDVITMNTKVILLVGDTEEEINLVYPSEADISKNKISVLSPIGTAILGYCEGSIIEWKVPDGTVQIEVKKVLFQPEAQEHYKL
ncbi:nucleoside diphosphate kinase regulator [Clostridium sp. FP2]|uniref:nucleoside diphosphate kinase regulator n=1 Tax=Clostridium TaxID=1485 RepID=UPI0013E96423|nr:MULTISPECIES: nucleoside diphosphate kinase regulator [Clostridium]MBW9156928.1 nucleoside diphosphate kinase regulator [Clostridium tagluense]MBZ9622091.1 nucleoside diphosphate kinase regulator [Clostridium sp. FP2]MCB2300852.1 nucleoside diphosphate kinase regulator [Clostridium tagluense]WLC66398.1 nucleoside diphosphate kinase regulator [Clostridium tagluense]